MRVVTSDATEAAATCAIALAQRHGIVVLNVICRGRRFRPRGNHQNRERVVERTPGAKVLVSLPGLEHPRVPVLMTAHADVIRKVGSQTGWIDDIVIDLRGFGPPRLNMNGTRAMAAFAADG